jgi:hypothetical protein
MMVLKQGLAVAALFFCTIAAVGRNGTDNKIENNYSSNYTLLPEDVRYKANDIFESLNLSCIGLEREVFYKAFKGYTYLLYKGLVNNPNVLTIADFSQSSKNKRLYVIDLANRRVAFNTFVSHGKNSGSEMATSFSNEKDSYKSTMGFMLTDDTYKGSCGYSLRFNGMEAGINDRIRNRDIIVHGSRYVNEYKADEDGRVGNSLGCPAVPINECREIIDFIKGGTVYFIHTPDEFYNESSTIINGLLVAPPPLINTSILPPNAIGPLAVGTLPAENNKLK